jgi:hypothetical protein
LPIALFHAPAYKWIATSAGHAPQMAARLYGWHANLKKAAVRAGQACALIWCVKYQESPDRDAVKYLWFAKIRKPGALRAWFLGQPAPSLWEKLLDLN